MNIKIFNIEGKEQDGFILETKDSSFLYLHQYDVIHLKQLNETYLVINKCYNPEGLEWIIYVKPGKI
jgi:hypothetical protein